MKEVYKVATIASMLAASALSASAATSTTAAADSPGMFRPTSSKTIELIPLQGGFTLHKYEDGKMAVENPFGRPVLMKEGQLLTTASGLTIHMVGNEVARLAAEFRVLNHP